MTTSNKRRLTIIRNSIVKTLKEQGRYTPLLHLQAEHTATLQLMVEHMRDELLSGNEDLIEVSVSREGHERAKQNPKYQIFAQYMDKLQASIKALGMNNDSKPAKEEDTGIEDFMNRFGNH